MLLLTTSLQIHAPATALKFQ